MVIVLAMVHAGRSSPPAAPPSSQTPSGSSTESPGNSFTAYGLAGDPGSVPCISVGPPRPSRPSLRPSALVRPVTVLVSGSPFNGSGGLPTDVGPHGGGASSAPADGGPCAVGCRPLPVPAAHTPMRAAFSEGRWEAGPPPLPVLGEAQRVSSCTSPPPPFAPRGGARAPLRACLPGAVAVPAAGSSCAASAREVPAPLVGEGVAVRALACSGGLPPGARGWPAPYPRVRRGPAASPEHLRVQGTGADGALTLRG